MLKTILFILALAIIVMSVSKISDKNKLESINSLNEKFNKFIYDNEIIVTEFVDMRKLEGRAKFIVDEENNCVYYLLLNNKNGFIECKRISFKDVLKCELIKDSKIKMVEDKFSIFDSFNKKEYVKTLGLRITFNDLSFTHLDIFFLNSFQGQTLSGLNHVVENTNKWIQIMNIVIERGKQLDKYKQKNTY